jgi:hypothetical protein
MQLVKSSHKVLNFQQTVKKNVYLCLLESLNPYVIYQNSVFHYSEIYIPLTFFNSVTSVKKSTMQIIAMCVLTFIGGTGQSISLQV